MKWLVLGIGVLITAELFLRLPLKNSLHALGETTRKAVRTVTSPRISDHWKEIVLPRYALRIFKSSLVSFLLLVLAILPFAIVAVLSGQTDFDIMQLAISPGGLIFSTILCIAYLKIRHKVVG